MKNTKNETSLRPFGLQFLEIPGEQLADATGGITSGGSCGTPPKKPTGPVTTQAISVPSTAGGRPDHF